jgi:hypothetical protein
MLRTIARTNELARRTLLARVAGASQQSRTFISFDAKYSDEMPLGDAATRIGASFGPALDMIAEAQRKREPVAKKEDTIYVPELPHIFPIARLAAKSEFVRDVLVVDESKRVKPRLSWYDPYDTSWVPTGWFKDGVVADVEYYFGDKAVKVGSK